MHPNEGFVIFALLAISSVSDLIQECVQNLPLGGDDGLVVRNWIMIDLWSMTWLLNAVIGLLNFIIIFFNLAEFLS